MLACLLAKHSLKKNIYSSLALWPLFIYLFFLYIVAVTHSNSPTVFFAYSLSALFPLTVFLFTRGVICDNSDAEESTITFLFTLLIIQVPVLIVQSFYFDHMSFPSGISVDMVDVRYGTFFMKSDATVGLFANLLLLYLMSGKWAQYKKSIMMLYFIAIFAVILLINSLLSKIAFCFIILMYAVKIYNKLDKFLAGSIFLLLIIVLIVVGVNVDFLKYYSIVSHERTAILNDIYRYHNASVPRYSVLLLLFNKVPLLGNGLFDYYNYLTKEWSFFAGHSLWLSLYNDTGPIGVLLVILFYWKMFFASARNKFVGFVQFTLSVSYSMTTFLLYDVGALLLLAFFSCLNASENLTRRV